MDARSSQEPRTYRDGDFVGVHLSPTWRDRTNYVLRAFIEWDEEKGNRWEQLWARKIAPNRFILCCIPFYVYGLALGDEVERDEDEVLHLLTASGQRTFRVWLGDQTATMVSQVTDELVALGPQIEAHSVSFLGLSIAAEAAQHLSGYLSDRQSAGTLMFERGN